MLKNPVLRWTATITGVILVMIAMFWAETMHRAWREFKEAKKAEKEGDMPMAILWYGTVISFYTPWSPWVNKSIERLFEIGKDAEKKGDYKLAKDAYDEIVHRIYSVRSFYTPHKDKQTKAKTLSDAVKQKI
ncbi:MAG: hypothetical protein V2A53_05130 [bacterium]